LSLSPIHFPLASEFISCHNWSTARRRHAVTEFGRPLASHRLVFARHNPIKVIASSRSRTPNPRTWSARGIYKLPFRQSSPTANKDSAKGSEIAPQSKQGELI